MASKCGLEILSIWLTCLVLQRIEYQQTVMASIKEFRTSTTCRYIKRNPCHSRLHRFVLHRRTTYCRNPAFMRFNTQLLSYLRPRNMNVLFVV